MKKPKTLINELRKELRYWQMQTRIDAKSFQGSKDKCKQIGAQMQAIINRSIK